MVLGRREKGREAAVGDKEGTCPPRPSCTWSVGRKHHLSGELQGEEVLRGERGGACSV